MKIGKLYFALVDPEDEFDDEVHNVEDLQVFDLTISQAEGEFAKASLEIKNPGFGLLSSSFKKRIFISCDFDGNIIPLFSGRVIGIPSDLSGETVMIEYIAQPDDWIDKQQTLVDSLKLDQSYYNKLFIDPDLRDDPAEILATRSELLHWDRTPDGNVTLSDILIGSSEIDVGDDLIYDSLKIRFGNPPIKQVDVSVEVQWIQKGIGDVDLSETIRNEFVNLDGSPSPQINTLTPLSFQDAWDGASVPSGYSIKQSILTPVVSDFGLTSEYRRSATVTVSVDFFPTKFGSSLTVRTTSVPRVWYTGTMILEAEYIQKRREILTFSLQSDIQDFSLLAENIETVDYKLYDPTEVDQDQIIPKSAATFFYDYNDPNFTLTSHGIDAVENALLRARAKIAKSSRVVESTFDVAISSLDILQIDCDKSIVIDDDRLPGGRQRGKVVAYSLNISPNGQIANISIASSIGSGITTSGTGTEISLESYVNYDDSLMDSSIFYEIGTAQIPQIPVDVEQLISDPEYAIQDITVLNSGYEQNQQFALESRPDLYLNDNKTSIEVDLLSMKGESEFLIEFDISTNTLTLPKQIDLGAT